MNPSGHILKSNKGGPGEQVEIERVELMGNTKKCSGKLGLLNTLLNTVILEFL